MVVALMGSDSCGVRCKRHLNHHTPSVWPSHHHHHTTHTIIVNNSHNHHTHSIITAVATMLCSPLKVVLRQIPVKRHRRTERMSDKTVFDERIQGPSQTFKATAYIHVPDKILIPVKCGLTDETIYMTRQTRFCLHRCFCCPTTQIEQRIKLKHFTLFTWTMPLQ